MRRPSRKQVKAANKVYWEQAGKPRYSRQCPQCRHKDIRFSSATDGRARCTCGRCGKVWTEG